MELNHTPNVRLGLPQINTLAYLTVASNMKGKKVYIIDTSMSAPSSTSLLKYFFCHFFYLKASIRTLALELRVECSTTAQPPRALRSKGPILSTGGIALSARLGYNLCSALTYFKQGSLLGKNKFNKFLNTIEQDV